ncbi:MAG: hypothetical protein DI565_00970 [Ancylobacter novellus]|uniref:diguanylate cyclase n=1 Tax=Ancylobacter novellus TaxID=921 RepID=A0A2W5KPP6_ANCNO|nr:MAG: hypothetical protein DI565_00970 [Ancylobacter novellus]
MVRLQHLQWGSAAAVAVCCLLLGGVALHSNYREYAVYEQGLRELDRLKTVTAAAVQVAAERGPANVAMTAAAENAKAAREALAAKRALVDAGVAAAAEELAGQSQERALLLAGLRQRLAAARAAVDAVVAAPAADRGSGSTLAAIDSMFAAADAAEALHLEIGRDMIAEVPRIALEVSLVTRATELRDRAGRLGSQVVAMLVAAGPPDEARYERLLEEAGKLAEYRDALKNVGKPYFGPGALSDAIEAVDRRYFNDGLTWAVEVARSKGWANGMGVGDFTQRYVPSLQPVEAFRLTVGQASSDRLASYRDDAWFHMIFSAVLAATACLIMIVIAIAFRRALFGPLSEVRDQLAAIAGGDLSDRSKRRRVGREIRDMFEGLEVLRVEQRQKRALESRQFLLTQRLKELSETDMLTGLLNRRAFEEQAAEALAWAERERRPFALLLFDIDRFKAINDGFGHAAGDAVLRKVARCAEARLGLDRRLARIGGEEFAAFGPVETETAAAAFAEALRAQIAELDLPETGGLAVTCSVGVAFLPAGADFGLTALLATADRRLYAAKAAGRNRVVSVDVSAARRGRGGSEAAA